LLRRHHWPGNISELKMVIQDMVQRSSPPTLDSSLLPAHLRDSSDNHARSFPASGMDLSEEVKRFEIAYLCEALKQSEGVQTKAAQLLGLKLTTLNMKIARYGIDVRAFK